MKDLLLVILRHLVQQANPREDSTKSCQRRHMQHHSGSLSPTLDFGNINFHLHSQNGTVPTLAAGGAKHESPIGAQTQATCKAWVAEGGEVRPRLLYV